MLTYYQSDDFEIRSSSGAYTVAISRTDFEVSSSITKNWNITCIDDLANNVEGYCDSDGEANGIFGSQIPLANILDAAVDVDWLISNDAFFHLNGHNARITAYYPDSPGGHCGGYSGRALPNSCNEFCISQNSWADNHVVAHEIGHVLHKRALDHCSGTLTDGSCGSYGWDSSGSEKCATAEGWASFVAGATYWENDSRAIYRPSTDSSRVLEDLTGRGNSSWDYCVSSASSPDTAPGNVARFFWDVYDSSTMDEGGTDNSSLPFITMLSVWSEFSIGTGNWQNNESGIYGVNVYDYFHYETMVDEEIQTNCVDTQSTF